MARNWNGLDLQTEFSELLGDDSTTFKTRVIDWINDIHYDMMTRFDWDYLKVKGQKILTALEEEQQLNVTTPTVPSVAISTGGSLIENSIYRVYITFVESSTGYETEPSPASSEVTATASDKTIDVTSIAVNTLDPLVTSRKIYLQVNSGDGFGDILFNQEIANNVDTTATITTESTSLIEAPDYIGIRRIDGNPFDEQSSQLVYRDIDQLRLLFQGTWSSGTASFWSPIGVTKVVLYPRPSDANTLSFYYIKIPPRIYASIDSQPFAPIFLKQVLKAGVIAMGYEYRDRNGQQEKRSNYEALLAKAFTDYGDPKRGSARVRDVVGDSDGFEV